MPSTPDRSGSIGRRRVLTVAKRECLSTITRRGYILTLVLMPLLLVGITLLPSLSVSLSGGPEALLGLNDPDELTVVGLVDLASPKAVDPGAVDWHNSDQALAEQEGRLLPAWAIDDVPVFMQSHAPSANRDRGGFQPDARIELRLYPDEAAATEAVRAEEADAAWVFPETYWETPQVRVLSAKVNPLNPGIHPGRRAAARLARASIASRTELDEPSKSRLLHVLEPEGKTVGLEGSEPVDPEGEALLDEVLATLLPMLFAAFFSMLIFVASGYLLDGVGEEKESRILEILLASVTPEELLLGKMLGLGAAGLLQTLFFGLLGLIPLLLLGSISIGPLAMVAMLVCAILGFAMYASLMGASGAIAGNRHEGRQISAVWTLSAASPVFVLPAFLTDPNQLAPVVMSFFPITAPVAMILRLGGGEVPGWQIAVSLIGMAATAWFAWRAGSRVFRVAILMTGSRPSLRTVWSWIRNG